MLLTALRCPVRPLRSSLLLSKVGRRNMSKITLDTYIVTPADLDSALKKNMYSKLSMAPKVIPLCASWFLPNDSRDGYKSFMAGRIPHARFFPLDEVKDPHSPYPHMLPSPEQFAKAVGRLGIHRDDTVVVYDTKELGIFSAPRVGWMFQVFGHPNIHVLNNFRKWCDEGFPIETGEPSQFESIEYPIPEMDNGKVAAFEEVKSIAKEQGKEGAEEVQILDARSEGRWKGVDPEPREGLESGHIPHSISLPISDLLDPQDKTLLPAQELKELFQRKGVDPSKPIITSCGTGVTAAVIDAALSEAEFPVEKRRLYDGSWTEWAQRVTPSDGLIQKST